MGCLGVFVLTAIALVVAALLFKDYYKTAMDRFERAGYVKVVGENIVVENTITNPTIFVANTVHVKRGSQRGLAFFCLSAEIEGRVVGNVHFKGVTLTLRRNALLEQDLDMLGVDLNKYGTVMGDITGYYTALHRKEDPKDDRMFSTNAIPFDD